MSDLSIFVYGGFTFSLILGVGFAVGYLVFLGNKMKTVDEILAQDERYGDGALLGKVVGFGAQTNGALATMADAEINAAKAIAAEKLVDALAVGAEALHENVNAADNRSMSIIDRSLIISLGRQTVFKMEQALKDWQELMEVIEGEKS